MDPVGRIAEIWRYPVSSVGGERMLFTGVTAIGLAGDRQFALIDVETGRPAAPEFEVRWRKALALHAVYTTRNRQRLPRRRTFLCLIGEKGKVLLTFFTDK